MFRNVSTDLPHLLTCLAYVSFDLPTLERRLLRTPVVHDRCFVFQRMFVLPKTKSFG
ncbi:hypothetical protein BaRGS_00010043, partial [Batillaria attramentaria]